MISYTVLSSLAVMGVILIDQVAHTYLIRRPHFWHFHLIIAFLTTLIDHFSNSRPIVIFNPSLISGLNIYQVPLENYLFGFSLITFNLILYEKIHPKK